MTKLLTMIACASILTAVPPSARGADPQGLFVQDLVAAINSKSPERRRAMLHPRSLVCANAAAGSFQDEMFSRQAERGVPAGYTWTITPVPPKQPPMFADTFDYPIHPTHLLQIDYATGPTSSTTIVLQLVYDAKQWREVTGCPKPGAIEAAREAAKIRAQQLERVQALVASVSPSLRNAVLTLVKEGRRVGAITRYASETGEDLATAKAVVDRLAAQVR
jgi:hypothetical protein